MLYALTLPSATFRAAKLDNRTTSLVHIARLRRRIIIYVKSRRNATKKRVDWHKQLPANIIISPAK